MSADWHTTQIEGVLRRTSRSNNDLRGSFTELWRASWTDPLSAERFVQANLSRSKPGVLRGMHFHRRQADLWMVVTGRVLTATTDVRALTASHDGIVRSQVIELMQGDALYIPALIAHGFWALEETALMYLVSNEYDASDEHGFKWNDPRATIDWPSGDPIVSDRDQSNLSLSEVVDQIRALG